MDIATGDITKGHLPKKAAKLVRNWCLDRQGKLMANWTTSHPKFVPGFARGPSK